MKTNIINSVNTQIYKILYIAILAMCLFLLFIPSTLFAQSDQEQKDALFQHLDKSKVTTGVLYDRVYPWVDLNVAKDSTFQTSYPFIKQACLELYLASYNKETLLSIEEVRDKILTNTLNDNGITLGFVDFSLWLVFRHRPH